MSADKESPLDRRRKLLHVSPDEVHRNPENPRIFFRDEEMSSLLASIAEHGIQVPITVYGSEGKYFLIDGERRWRCATKLNLKSIPAMLEDKPSPLQNLLLMYNIHALREQWDYFTIASKLPRVIELFDEEHGREPGESELARLTGLGRGQVRRCRFLLKLPERFKADLLAELEKPKQKQRLSEDLFIEMERALQTVTKRVPELSEGLDAARDALVDKYRRQVIGTVLEFRKLRKLATSISRLDVSEKRVVSGLSTLFDKRNDVGITEIYERIIGLREDASRALLAMQQLTQYCEEVTVRSQAQVDEEFVKRARSLIRALTALVGK